MRVGVLEDRLDVADRPASAGDVSEQRRGERGGVHGVDVAGRAAEPAARRGWIEASAFVLETEDLTSTIIPDSLREAYLDIDVPFTFDLDDNQVNVRRHCFRGRRRLPLDVPAGRYRIYMTVSNVNHVLLGTPPVEAARIIGGQELGTHSQALLCTFMLLGDHVFDIF